MGALRPAQYRAQPAHSILGGIALRNASAAPGSEVFARISSSIAAAYASSSRRRDTSNCGTCVVLMDGEPAKSCTVLAATAANYEITTVEGLERDGVLDPVQQGFHEEHGLQCGFCTPGMMLTARALLNRNPDPTDEEIRAAISGQICRCTGYATIVRSIRWAAEYEARGFEAP